MNPSSQLTINWTTSPQDADLIAKIVKRFTEMLTPDSRQLLDQLQTTMDITACHCNGCPLKLWQLYASDSGDFANDVIGILTRINRQTGGLIDGYRPKFAVEITH